MDGEAKTGLAEVASEELRQADKVVQQQGVLRDDDDDDSPGEIFRRRVNRRTCYTSVCLCCTRCDVSADAPHQMFLVFCTENSTAREMGLKTNHERIDRANIQLLIGFRIVKNGVILTKIRRHKDHTKFVADCCLPIRS